MSITPRFKPIYFVDSTPKQKNKTDTRSVLFFWRRRRDLKGSAPTRVACRALSPALARLCSLALWLLRFEKTILNRFFLLTLAGSRRFKFKFHYFSNKKTRQTQGLYFRRRDLKAPPHSRRVSGSFACASSARIPRALAPSLRKNDI